MVLILRKRWHVAKYSDRTGQLLTTTTPEAKRHFWTRNGAVRELQRLTAIAFWKKLPYHYKVERIYGR